MTDPQPRTVRNPRRADTSDRPHADAGDTLAFHRRLPGYEPTPLLDLGPDAAASAGVGRLLLKDERRRFGLPAFKMLGASWATYRALIDRLGHEPDWGDFGDLRRGFAPLDGLGLAAATDGNHGRAVARMAKELAMPCTIFVPANMVAARIAAIESEGAQVVVVDGTYDDAVRRSAQLDPGSWQVVSDTSWPGYDTVPRWVIDGYATIGFELDELLDGPPDVVAVPLGVGALGAAIAEAYPRAMGAPPFLLGVEPTVAACVLAAAEAGHIVEVPGPHDSIMAGLNCGLASPVAFPAVAAGYDAFVTITDDACADGIRRLAAAGIDVGECGAAGLVGFETSDPAVTPRGDDVTVVCICTEGVTDPVRFEAIVGRPPAH